MNQYIFSTEPGEFPWSKVLAGRTRWDGVRGPLARRHLRTIRAGDGVWGYHSSPEKALVCRARVAGSAYPDPADPAWLAVDVEFDRWLARPISLAEMKKDTYLNNMDFLRIPRLSIAPLTHSQNARLQELEMSSAEKKP